MAQLPEQQLGLYQGKKPVLGTIDFYDFVPVAWRTAGGQQVVVIFAYFTPGHPAIYAAKLSLLGAFVGALRPPWVVMADWNLEPAQLRATT
eukprot:3047497-Lingulodinium_polyedra.AAC.1